MSEERSDTGRLRRRRELINSNNSMAPSDMPDMFAPVTKTPKAATNIAPTTPSTVDRLSEGLSLAARLYTSPMTRSLKRKIASSNVAVPIQTAQNIGGMTSSTSLLIPPPPLFDAGSTAMMMMNPPPSTAKRTRGRPLSTASHRPLLANSNNAVAALPPPPPQQPQQQQPSKGDKGLRHFSAKVCAKVEEKGTTSYNEVADELVQELGAELGVLHYENIHL